MAQSVDDNGDHGQETGSAFREALETFKRKLSERNFQRLEGISSRDVKFEIIRIQRDQERLKAMLNFRRMEEFIVKTEELQTILTDFLHADAGHYISYVWGAMRFLLMVRNYQAI